MGQIEAPRLGAGIADLGLGPARSLQGIGLLFDIGGCAVEAPAVRFCGCQRRADGVVAAAERAGITHVVAHAAFQRVTSVEAFDIMHGSAVFRVL